MKNFADWGVANGRALQAEARKLSKKISTKPENSTWPSKYFPISKYGQI